jgi:isovaleryl-CoA dehydrogenase
MKVQLLEDEILDAMSLQKQYNILNNNLMLLLSDEDKTFMEELQGLCLAKDEEIGGVSGHNKADVYDWFPWAGKHGLVNRSNEYPHRDDLRIGLKTEILRQWTMDIFNPQFSMALGASVLCVNPIAHHYKENSNPNPLQKDLEGLLDGTKIGCIGITEPERGSDAVNMTTTAEKADDGVIVNGVKCYTTNSPKADFCAVYALYNTEDPRSTMVQGISHKDWDRGFKAERLGIPSVSKMYIGKTIFEDSFIPNDYITGDDGKGYEILFEGLVPERIGIAAAAIGNMWGAFTLGSIYSTLRKQFGTPPGTTKIIRHQAVGMSVLAKYHARLSIATMALLKLAETYDEKKDDLAHLPPTMNPLVATASHMKEYCAFLNHELSYEMMHVMGGTGVTDQTKMPHHQGISEISEAVGGTRNVQLLIGSRTINAMVKMS